MKITGKAINIISLTLILSVSLFALVYFSYSQAAQVAVLVAVAAAYVTWGVIHHHIRRDLYFSVFLEYFTIAAFGVVVGLALILQK